MFTIHTQSLVFVTFRDLFTNGKTFVMDYEAYTFVFFIKKNKEDFFIKM